MNVRKRQEESQTFCTPIGLDPGFMFGQGDAVTCVTWTSFTALSPDLHGFQPIRLLLLFRYFTVPR